MRAPERETEYVCEHVWSRRAAIAPAGNFLQDTISFLLAASHFEHLAALLLCLELVVNLATVCDFDDEDDDLVVVNICEDSVIADSVTPEFFVDELFAELARTIKLGELLLKKITDPFHGGRVARNAAI